MCALFTVLVTGDEADQVPVISLEDIAVSTTPRAMTMMTVY
jgi:hypothetical protein